MDFKAALTLGSKSPASSIETTTTPLFNLEVEDLPSDDEEDLACCESFYKLYLIGKFLGESVPLKSMSSKLKAKWKTHVSLFSWTWEMIFFSLYFLPLRIIHKCGMRGLFFIQKQVIVL